MTPKMQNPAGGPGFAGKAVVCDDQPLVANPAALGNDNSASAQRSRLLAALIKGPVSTLAARKYHDILHPAARVQELRDRGHLIDTQDEVGGWPALTVGTAPVDTDADGIPDEWEHAHGLNPNDAKDSAALTASGYTNLELYLNALAGTPAR